MNCQDVDALAPLYLSGELAGELDSARASEVAAHLESCPECARSIRQQRELDARLRESVLGEGVPGQDIDAAAMNARVRRDIGDARRIRRGKWIAVTSVAAMLAVAVGGYVFLPTRSPLVMCADAAQDHRVEVVEHRLRAWLTDAAAIGALAAKHGLSASAAEAIAPVGYRLEHGKLCRLGGRIFLHLVYSDGAHQFSFYLRDSAPSEISRATSAERSLETGRAIAPGPNVDLGSEHVAQVESRRFTALVVTDESRDAARDIARFAATHL